jgi:hypothetical protein
MDMVRGRPSAGPGRNRFCAVPTQVAATGRMTIYILTLLATVAAEFLILWLLTRQPPLRVLVYSILINSMTQPIATYIYMNLHGLLWVVEFGVVLVESALIMLLFRLKYRRALFFSVAANSATTLLGVLWFYHG